MLCIRQKCVCTTGYRLLQVPNFAVKCIKAIGGSTLKYPQNCEAPTGCDFHLSFFVFQAPSDDSSVPPPSPPQRYASITLITDVRHYINEYYQVVLNEEKIKFFVDNDGIMRVVLDEKFNKFYKSLAQQDGYRIRVSREAGNNPPPSVEDEPVLVRKPRYIIKSHKPLYCYLLILSIKICPTIVNKHIEYNQRELTRHYNPIRSGGV